DAGASPLPPPQAANSANNAAPRPESHCFRICSPFRPVSYLRGLAIACDGNHRADRLAGVDDVQINLLLLPL
ncbi:MAG TPA: hypothetical protein VGA75_08640, partial [Paracoccaceae bacterium]